MLCERECNSCGPFEFSSSDKFGFSGIFVHAEDRAPDLDASDDETEVAQEYGVAGAATVIMP